MESINLETAPHQCDYPFDNPDLCQLYLLERSFEQT